MKSVLLLTLCGYALSRGQKGVATSKYRAYIDADGQDLGHFEVDLREGEVTYKIRLKNLLSLGTGEEGETFDAGDELAWHLHSLWGNGGCGSDQTGGHYDPFYQCGPASGQQGDAICDERAGYYCEDVINTCEVGDLSGIFGKLTIDQNGKVEAEYSTDVFLPLKDDYEGATNGASWKSIVFHNGASGARVACGDL